MTRAALEHVLRAAAAVTDEREIVVIGSQAVLGQYPEAPAALLVSIEADVYRRHAPYKADLIDGAIGELSMFHQAFGYYAHGVDDTTATLPSGWADRLVPIRNENRPEPPVGASTCTTWRPPDLVVEVLSPSRVRYAGDLPRVRREGVLDRRSRRQVHRSDRLGRRPANRDTHRPPAGRGPSW